MADFQQMQNYTVPDSGEFTKVYVLLRVFNLGRATDMRIFVDPYRLQDQFIDFEAATYHCKTRLIA